MLTGTQIYNCIYAYMIFKQNSGLPQYLQVIFLMTFLIIFKYYRLIIAYFFIHHQFRNDVEIPTLADSLAPVKLLLFRAKNWRHDLQVFSREENQ